MPFWLHAIGVAADTGRPYDTKEGALSERSDGETVTYIATPVERNDWQRRERLRLRDGTYAVVPWATDYGDSSCHYAHLSTIHPGLIAYTPNDEYGVQDKQLRVRPGKYLAEFFPQVAKVQRDAWCDACKAFSGTLQLATSTADIVTVYRNGPGSCMAHATRRGPHCHMCEGACSSPFTATGSHHPCEVYGESDLAVAYLGTLNRVSARCVVWPEHKVYTRIYGDATLQHILQANGYSSGNLNGARVRKIRLDDGYLMPYVDEAEGCNVTGAWMTLALSNWDYEVRETSGVVGGNGEYDTYCANCETPTDGETYCPSCHDNRWTCNGCHGESFNPDASFTFDHYNVAYCRSCYDNAHRPCDVCDRSFSEYDYPRQLRTTRQQRAHYCADVCETCYETHTYCDLHTVWYFNDDDGCERCANIVTNSAAETETISETERAS